MAKQTGAIKITGTIQNICFYKMGDKYYARMKSSLDAKKFWKAKQFEGSRKSCKRFAEGIRLATQVYRGMDREKRKYEDYCRMKSEAILMVKKGLKEEEIVRMLKELVEEKKIVIIETVLKKQVQRSSKKKMVRTYSSVYGIPYERRELRSKYKGRMVVKASVVGIDSS